MKDMLHKIFAHISPESPKSAIRVRLFTALALTLTVFVCLSLSGVASAKTTNAQGGGQARPASKLPPNIAKYPNAYKSRAKALGKSLQFGAHPNNSPLSANFINFQFAPSLPESFESPGGVAFDPSGNLYVCDQQSGDVDQLVPNATGGYTLNAIAVVPKAVSLTVDPYSNLYVVSDPGSPSGSIYLFTPLSGGGYSSTPTAIIGTSLVNPWQAVVDPYGDIFIADYGYYYSSGSGYVWEEIPNGSGGYTEVQIASGYWYAPDGIAVDFDGNVYVADEGYNGIFEVPNDGSGFWGTPIPVSGGYFDQIYDIGLAPNGTIYVTDGELSGVWALYPVGNNEYVPSLLSESFDIAGQPALDSNGNLYVGDYFGTVQQFNNNLGAIDVGFGNNPNLNVTVNFAIDGSGTLGTAQVTSQGQANGEFTNVGGLTDTCSGGTFVSSGTCSVTVQFAPAVPGTRTGGVTLVDNAGNYVGTSQAFTGTGVAPRSSFLPGTLNYIGGSYTYAKQAPDFAQKREKNHLKVPKSALKVAPNALINDNYPGYEPDGIAVDPEGNIFVADQYYCAIYAFFPASVTETNDGWTILPNYDSLCPSGGLALDGNGNVFFSAWYTGTGGATIAYDINLGYDATLLQNTYSAPEPAVIYTNTGSGIPYYISNLTVDGFDNVYFTGSDDSYTDAYAFVQPAEALGSGAVTFPWEYINRLPTQFQYLTGIAVNNYGSIALTDYYLGEAFIEIPQSNNTYYEYQAVRNLDTPVAVAWTDYSQLYDNPNGDYAGDLYIVDSGDDTGISAIYVADYNYGDTVYGAPTYGYSLYPLNLSYYYDYGDAYYWNLAIDSNNNFYLTDDGFWGGLITQLDVNDPPSIVFDTTDVGIISVDSPETVFLTNTGNDALVLPALSGGSNPSISANFTLNSSSYTFLPGGLIYVDDCPLVTSGSYDLYEDYFCALPVSFIPQVAGDITGTLVITDDSLYGSSSVPLARGAKRAVKAYASAVRMKNGKFAKPAAISTTAQTIDLSGVALDFFSIDFSISSAGNLPLVKAGGSLTLSLVVAPNAPATTLPLPVTLAGGGGPQNTSYTFVPSVIPAGSGSTTVALTINVPVDYTAKNDVPVVPGKNDNTKLPVAPLALALLLLPMAGKLRKAGKRMSKLVAMLLLAVAGMTATATLIGCGANKAAVYEIVVTATSGVLSHQATFDIVVEGR
jgi:hypothetical protein